MAQLISGPAQMDLAVYAGDANEVQVEILADGVPVDCTGATLTASARATAADPVVAIEADVAIIDATVGQFAISWDGEALRPLLSGDTWTGVWDLSILFAGATLPRTLLRGKFVAVLDVTRGATP